MSHNLAFEGWLDASKAAHYTACGCPNLTVRDPVQCSTRLLKYQLFHHYSFCCIAPGPDFVTGTAIWLRLPQLGLPLSSWGWCFSRERNFLHCGSDGDATCCTTVRRK
ncbi:uncharacterized protein LOC142768608 [Rhipicephalus microplus]|uniref:uncharacterized protein LOC142768608 n=1 Tax=Rhipicephalus microplus TaxID=6941 RepID=UPI003F6B5C65